jgi:hypothetical protein
MPGMATMTHAWLAQGKQLAWLVVDGQLLRLLFRRNVRDASAQNGMKTMYT